VLDNVVIASTAATPKILAKQSPPLLGPIPVDVIHRQGPDVGKTAAAAAVLAKRIVRNNPGLL
jgi:hypothetical protein